MVTEAQWCCHFLYHHHHTGFSRVMSGGNTEEQKGGKVLKGQLMGEGMMGTLT
ncbi:hypothetical protein D4764_21G0007940 [Takifugu flavidus]|uniref:Uncharacterized protein n=1 Tax=Takifugu flavidus TaxID=433684 RepID=A0A5C6NEF7_9TELE|nr:hypothetical protein D4764_21G0007940 [Takifugu flavidus]